MKKAVAFIILWLVMAGAVYHPGPTPAWSMISPDSKELKQGGEANPTDVPTAEPPDVKNVPVPPLPKIKVEPSGGVAPAAK